MVAYGLTDKGVRRKNNEDHIFYSIKNVGAYKNLFIVADGVAGKNAGEYVSRMATKRFIRYTKDIKIRKYIKELKYDDAYVDIINKVNDDIYKKSKNKEKFKEMCTTFLICTIDNNNIYISNVGDSRLYIINDKIEKITKDNNLKEEVKELFNVNLIRKNIITKALGHDPRISPDTYERKLQQEDKILLCSDGLTNMVSNEEIFKICNSNLSITEKVTMLIKKANDSGGVDNISVILIENI